ncbi:MAG: peptide chain release factor 2 [Clostridia bacterium]|nr:peptide chain release factor 2 [Clostridia bacterium]
MILLDDYRLKLVDIGEQIEELASAMRIKQVTEKLAEYEQLTSDPEFWNDMERSQKILVEQKRQKSILEAYQAVVNKHEDAQTLVELAMEECDEETEQEIVSMTEELEKTIEHLTMDTLLDGEYDKSNAILTFHAGAGGTEAQDWALMLFRMYSRYGEQNGFKVKCVDMLDGDEAGIKSAVLLLEGENAYGYMKSESGVHRLVRVSPFDASGRRQTSFASVEVMPEIEDDKSIEIREEDLEIECHRASGAGGQHVNKTDSAVRIKHIPTGIVTGCQTERSQKQNREMAMKMLKSKLLEIKEREHLEKIEDIKGVQMDNGWGSQIRSYVFMPYTLVKDHRTNFEMGNVNAVMDGDLEGFINAYLKYLKSGAAEN